jgi:hypothetical protein
MTRRRKRFEPWGSLNLAVNLGRLLVELARLFWHMSP